MVNYGLRWDYYGVVKEKNNLFANFLVTSFDPVSDTGTGTYQQVGTPGLSRLYEPDYKNFSPRASIEWDVTGKGKTVVRIGAGLLYDAFSQDMFLGHLPFSAFYAPGPAYGNFGPAPILSAGLAVSTLAVNQPVYGDETACNFECDIFAVDPHIKTPYMENYNINIQQQFGSKTTLQVGYVGSQGHRLFRFYDINQPSHAIVTAADCPLGIATCATTGSIQDFGVPRPFGDAGVGAFYIYQERSTGKSNYNSLQISFKVNGWHGITSALNYVYSKSLDNSSDLEDFVPNAAQPQDSNNPQLEYGPSNFNIPHRLTWVIGYELPNRGGSMQRLKNGWGFDSTVSLQSGQPFTLTYNCEDDYSGGARMLRSARCRRAHCLPQAQPGGLHRTKLVCHALHNHLGRTKCAFWVLFRLCSGYPALWELGPQCSGRPNLQTMGLCSLQEHSNHRARKTATSGRVFQYLEPSQFLQSASAGISCRPRF